MIDGTLNRYHGKHESNHPIVKKHVKRFFRVALFVLMAHFILHFGWYAFHTLWVEELGLIDPAELGKKLSGSVSAPITVFVMGVLAWLQSYME